MRIIPTEQLKSDHHCRVLRSLSSVTFSLDSYISVYYLTPSFVIHNEVIIQKSVNDMNCRSIYAINIVVTTVIKGLCLLTFLRVNAALRGLHFHLVDNS